MTKIYDNGAYLLGRKKDIYEMALTRANDDQAAPSKKKLIKL